MTRRDYVNCSHMHRCGGGRYSRMTRHDYVKYLRTTRHGCVNEVHTHCANDSPQHIPDARVVARRTRVYFELNSSLFS